MTDVNFHSFLSDTQIACNLLIRTSQSHLFKHRLFARCQRIDTYAFIRSIRRPQLLRVGGSMQGCSFLNGAQGGGFQYGSTCSSLTDGSEQVVWTDILLQVADCACVDGPLHAFWFL